MNLFVKKSTAELKAEADSNRFKRALGPVSLTTLGIGAIIGAGLFVMTGTAASQNAGPALVLSMLWPVWPAPLPGFVMPRWPA